MNHMNRMDRTLGLGRFVKAPEAPKRRPPGPSLPSPLASRVRWRVHPSTRQSVDAQIRRRADPQHEPREAVGPPEAPVPDTRKRAAPRERERAATAPPRERAPPPHRESEQRPPHRESEQRPPPPTPPLRPPRLRQEGGACSVSSAQGTPLADDAPHPPHTPAPPPRRSREVEAGVGRSFQCYSCPHTGPCEFTCANSYLFRIFSRSRAVWDKLSIAPRVRPLSPPAAAAAHVRSRAVSDDRLRGR